MVLQRVAIERLALRAYSVNLTPASPFLYSTLVLVQASVQRPLQLVDLSAGPAA
jgi:hypothetical protein